MKSAKIFIIFTLLLAISACVEAQNPYPNELKDYEFFGVGKLKDLRLAASSVKDVKKNFGEQCEKRCDYDKNWWVYFEYYEDIWIKQSRNENGELLTYLLDSKYLGKLRSVEIWPKNQISFVDVSFPDSFQHLETSTTADTRSGQSRLTIYDSFQDSHGLSYQIYARTNYDNIKSEKTKSYGRGQLVSVRYALTKELENDLFVLQK